MRIGLSLGLLNEKNNQLIEYKIKEADENNENKIIIGDANMLKNM